VLVHDAHHADPTTAFAISRLTGSGPLTRAPIGIFRQVERPTYDDLTRDQAGTPRTGGADLQRLLDGQDTWTVD
jgi:2-oxoglutarate ferredoxin oxidoreductase subunit beta